MRKIIVLSIFLILNITSWSQSVDSLIHPLGIPTSFVHHITFSSSFRSSMTAMALPVFNNASLTLRADSIEQYNQGGLHYYGQGIRNPVNLKSSAQYYNSNIDNGKLWILKISSSTALGFQLYFSKFNLPEGAFLHIYTADTSRILGPFSSANTPDDTLKQIQFQTQPIMGNEIYLEYYENDSSEFPGTIEIDNIIHIFRSPFDSNTSTREASFPCQEDVACLSGWGEEANSVAKVFIYDPYSIMQAEASGALLNNTAQDGTPYFLTAAHNLHNIAPPYDLSTWEFGFDYENLTCLPSFAGSDPFMHQLVTGATLLAQDNVSSTGYPYSSDYLLLLLNTTPAYLNAKGICYSGWSKNAPLSTPSFSSTNEFVLIHHPNGDVKKISKGNNLRTSARTTPPFSSSDHYMTDIIYGGATEVGSSGSPLYNSSHKIIGMASAYIPYSSIVYDACDNSTYQGQYFGRFDRDWALGYFSTWLDPTNLLDPASPSYSSFYDGPSTYCPNPSAQVIDPPVVNTFQDLNQGIKISGHAGDITTLCSTDDYNNLVATPVSGTQFYVDGYSRKVDCSTVTNSFGLVGGCDPVTILGIPTGKCMCNYYSYSVSISELDNSLNAIGWPAVKTMEYHTWTAGLHGVNHFTISVPYILGHSFVAGKFYRITVGNIVSGSWYSSSQVIYVLPYSLTVSNSTVSNNIYAINDITLENTTVSNDVQVVASYQVTVLPNSVLEAGEYFTENVDCNSFRMAETVPTNTTTQNSLNYSYTNSAENPIMHKSNDVEKKDLKFTTNISILPNPNDGTFQVSVMKDNSGIGIKEIKIYDFLGKIVWTQGPSPNSTFNVDITGYSQGIYYVRVIDEMGEIRIEKLAKQ